MKLRQFAELLAQLIAAKTGLYEAGDESQADLLRRLRFERVLPPQVADLFQSLRTLGNNAAHGTAGSLREALNALKYARQASLCFTGPLAKTLPLSPVRFNRRQRCKSARRARRHCPSCSASWGELFPGRAVLGFLPGALFCGLPGAGVFFGRQIFGEPIFTYSYREAVIDGYLIDHEPPIRIETELTRAGITFQRDEQLEIFDTRTGKVDLVRAPDEIRFEVDSFNRRVITQEFNRVVAEELAKHIDPSLPGKTLLFASTDGHADILVNEIKKAMEARYGEIKDAAVRKVTGSVFDLAIVGPGSSRRPCPSLCERWRNE